MALPNDPARETSPGAAPASAVRPAPAAGWRAWLPPAATLVAVIVFVAAGNWQRDRMEQKLALRAQLDAALAAAPVGFPRGVEDWSAWRFRPVVARGRFEPAGQILLDNKLRGGVVGYEVVTPLALEDGRRVLVNRGFVPAGARRSELPTVPPAADAVVVRGRVTVPLPGYFEFKTDAPQGVVWQHLDPARYASVTGNAVLPAVIEATAPTGGDDALLREWPAPDFGVEKHRIYMLQWFAFALLAVGLWGWFWLRPRLAAKGRW